MPFATSISVLVIFFSCFYNISADFSPGDNVEFINIQGIESEDATCNIPKSFNIRLNGQIEVNPKNEPSSFKSVIEPMEDRISFASDCGNAADDKFEKILQYLNDIEKRLENLEHDIELKSEMGVRYKHSNIKNGSSTNVIPTSCKEVLRNGHNTTGLYRIQPRTAKKPIVVLCDMDIRGGGWTNIQKRFDGSQNFLLGWREYKFGFGDLDGEFWIGLENIYTMTGSENNELLIEVADRDGKVLYAHYKSFGIGTESNGYFLNVLDGFSGNAGDSLSYHFGAKFTTIDFDQDVNSGNCAVIRSGAWWYKDCYQSSLNGKYLNLPLNSTHRYNGMHWGTFHGKEYSHAKSRMLIKPA